jgi:O-antigen/teichoic acid export membrane protein
MLAKQTAIYFVANLFSAIFGLVNTMVFTRIFAVESYGDYLLGLAFASLLSTFLSSALKLAIMREQARGDGADVRQTILMAFLLYCPASPIAYGVARLTGLEPMVAAASVLLGLAIVLYDTTQEVLRAEQKARGYLRGTVYRAVLVSAFGMVTALYSTSGVALLVSSSTAFVVAAGTVWRLAWSASRPRFDGARLRAIAEAGAPFTFSMSLMALAGVADRFLVAELAGVGAAGQFGASLDLVRQALIIPAISVSSAFVPMTVRLLAAEGEEKARSHLAGSVEFLLAVVLPACVGFALVAPQVADLVLGADFRATARAAIPVLSIAVVFQIATQQYLHTSFLLSNRNAFYLVNAGSMLVFNIALAALLIPSFGVMGAVWGRLGTEIFGVVVAHALSRRAFPMPVPLRRLARVVLATAAMAAVVRLLGAEAEGRGPAALLVLVPAGVCAYAAAAWLLDIADIRRLSRGLIRPRRATSQATAG